MRKGGSGGGLRGEGDLRVGSDGCGARGLWCVWGGGGGKSGRVSHLCRLPCDAFAPCDLLALAPDAEALPRKQLDKGLHLQPLFSL